LLLALLVRNARAAEEAAPVRFQDDFATDTRKDYETKGDVTWRKSVLILGKEAVVSRKLALSCTTEVRAVVRWHKDQRDGLVILALVDAERRRGAVFLRLVKGRTELVRPHPPERVVVLDADEAKQNAAPVWVVRLDVSYGLLRAKAWRKGDKEPADWQCIAYLGKTTWQPQRLVLETGPSGGGSLESWAVRGVAPLRLSAEQQRDVQQAEALNQEAFALYQQGQYAKAVAKAREALALRRKALLKDHPDLAASLNNLGLLLKAMGWREEARKHYEEALSLRRKALPKDHPDLANSLHNLGALLRDMGRRDEARKHLEAALAIQCKALPKDHPDLAASLNTLGVLLNAMGRHDEARKHLEEALAIRRKILPPLHPDLANSLNNLGLLLQDMGRYDEARQLLEEALTLQRKVLPKDHPDLAYSLNNLGLLLQDMGRYDEARKHYEQALALRRKVLPKDHPDLANSLNNLGILLHAMGRHDEARKHLEEALTLLRKALPKDHPDLAASLDNLGVLLNKMGRHDEARKHLEEALTLRRKALPPLHPDLAHSLNNLGLLLRDMGRREEAHKHYEEALAIQRKALPKDHPEVATGLNNLGVLLQDMGKNDEARQHYEEALALLRKALPKDHPKVATSLHNLGVLLQDMGANKAAWRCAQEAVTILEGLTAQISVGSAQHDHAALARQARPYLYAFLSLAAQTASLSARQRQQVLTALLDGKALSSTALTRQREAVLLQPDAEAVALLGKLRPLRRRLADLLLQGPGVLPAQRYRDLCEQLQKEHDDLERDLAQRVKGYAELRRAQQAAPQDLAARLPPDGALLELARYQRVDFKTKRWGADHYLAVLLWREAGERAQPQIRLVPLGAAKPIDRIIHAWRTHAQRGTINDKSDRELRQRLWAPLAQALPEKTTRLFLAPDGELALVPFEAIREANGKYVVERLHVSYLTTGRDLMPRPQPKQKSDLALVLADPDYDSTGADDKPLAKTNPAATPRGDDLRSQFKALQSLPGFAREAQAVQKLLKDRGWRPQLHTGADASEETLRSVSRPRLLYCITHGFFLADRPRPATPDHLLRELALVDAGPHKWRLPDPGPDPRLASGLALAGANRWQQRSKRGISDGLLTALEAEDLDLWGTELVVLSACDTGRGQVQVGEGVLGLRRAFQQAGAQTVLASLWKVPDAETEQLMTAFLRRWLEGADKSEALRQAQLELIQHLRKGKNESKRTAPPLYWAAFICHGQPQ
jgi:tetratricopeptide (TPR) repeat protein/CHAT domain-containing protein